MVRLLEELFRKDEPQDELAPLLATSLPTSLLVLLLEVSDLGVLVEFPSLVASSTSTTPPPLLSLAPVIIFPASEPSTGGKIPKPEVGPSDHLLLFSVPPLVDLSGPLVMMGVAIGLISLALPPPPLMLLSMMVA